MAPVLYWEGTNITNYLVSYRRDDNLCDSTSMIDIVLSNDCPHVFNFSDELIIHENGNKKGTYSINNIVETLPTYTKTITGTNSQLNLEYHFITEKYFIVDTPLLKSRYWMEKFLIEAGVSYNFTVAGDGEFLPDDIVLGGTLAIDVVRQLLQYSGWYLRYDENGTAQIGTLEYDSNYYSNSITDSTILELKTLENDAFLRNRAVVWGMGSLDTDSGWVFADISTQTAWNYDSNDKRTVVLSNSYISDYATALSLARKMLTEFTKPNFVKTVKIAGFVNTFVGDRVRLNSSKLGAICSVTTMSVEFGSNGSMTTLGLDERCPRMIGYFNYGGYVYAGTEDYGVWRKPLKYDPTWEQDSVGLGNIHVSDLSIHAGLFSCVAASGLYIRSPETVTWSKITPYILESGIAVTDSVCTATTVHRGRNVAHSLFTYADALSGWGFSPHIVIDNPRSWLIETQPNGISITYPIVVDTERDYIATSLDNNGKDTYITAVSLITGSGITPMQYNRGQGTWQNTIQEEGHPKSVSAFTEATTEKAVPNFGISYNDYLLHEDHIYSYDQTGHGVSKYNYKTDTKVSTISEITDGYTDVSDCMYEEDIVIRWNTQDTGSATQLFTIEIYNFITDSVSEVEILERTNYDEYMYQGSHMCVGDKVVFIYWRNTWEDVGWSIVSGAWHWITYDLVTETVSSEYTIVSYSGDVDWQGTYPPIAIMNGRVYGFVYYTVSGVGTYTDSFCLNVEAGTSGHENTGHIAAAEDYFGTAMGNVIPNFTTNTVYGIIWRDTEEIWRTTIYLDGSLINIAQWNTEADSTKWPSDFVGNSTRQWIISSTGNYDTYIWNMDEDLIQYFDSNGSTITYHFTDNVDDSNNDIIYAKGVSSNWQLRKFHMLGGLDTLLYENTVYPDFPSFLNPIGFSILGTIIACRTMIFYTEVSGGGTGSSDRILKFSNGVFEDQGYTPTLLNVESSKSSPVVLYGGYQTLNGANMYTNIDDTFNQWMLPYEYYMLDLRVTEMLLSDSYNRYLMFLSTPTGSGTGRVRTLDIDTNTLDTFVPETSPGVPIEGLFSHLETTNTQDIPYIFYSMSGVPPVFYQLTGGDYGDVSISEFVEESTGLPNSPITVIRADDII